MNDFDRQNFRSFSSSLPHGRSKPDYLCRLKTAAARVQMQGVLCALLRDLGVMRARVMVLPASIKLFVTIHDEYPIGIAVFCRSPHELYV
ncbi:hypothetical protein SRM_01072 [Salinibacter ruber M8]|uniref:Uncharacterized protein n=1 Tax=Salinibacter ruber (strain M8) TaxID=761659 RepID=D5H7I8_SALRM|nr:hypothetical protein SRM_01072 [Salinibacter ruber M8]